MYSKHLEDLIEATLADGKLDPYEVEVLKKAAEKEGVDIDELQVYMNSLAHKRTAQETTQQTEKNRQYEKQRKGNVCPHCGVPIPPMTKICPECGQVVNANETSGDKELFELIDKIEASIVEVKTLNADTWLKDKATAESLIHKAKVFYGENKKVQMLVYDLKEEIQRAEVEMKKIQRKSKTPIGTRIICALILLALVVTGYIIILAFFAKGRGFLSSTWSKVID